MPPFKYMTTNTHTPLLHKRRSTFFLTLREQDKVTRYQRSLNHLKCILRAPLVVHPFLAMGIGVSNHLAHKHLANAFLVGPLSAGHVSPNQMEINHGLFERQMAFYRAKEALPVTVFYAPPFLLEQR